MKKILYLVLIVFAILSTKLPVSALERLDSYSKFTLTTNKTTALADGKDAIHFTFGHFLFNNVTKGYDPACETPDYIGAPNILLYIKTLHLLGTSSDSSIKINGKNSYEYGAENPIAYIIGPYNCQTGYLTFDATSTSAGEKTIGVLILNGREENAYDPVLLKVNFTNPTPKTITPKSTPTPTPTPKPAPALPPKPTIQLTSKIKTDKANQIKTIITETAKTAIRQNEKLTFSGTTSPNAKVTLTIHSDPITQEVTANQKGEWSYILDPVSLKLPLGEHNITAIATDSQGIKSDIQTLTSFTLKRDLKPIPKIVEDNSNPYINRMTILLFLLFIGSTLIGIMFIKRNRSNKKLPTT